MWGPSDKDLRALKWLAIAVSVLALSAAFGLGVLFS